jgi:polar amino acid transport system substrate-binding protein
MRKKFLAVSSALNVLLVSVVSANAADTITLHYVHRPPYAISEPNREPHGVVALPASFVFKKAGIPFVWKKTPVNRQFALIQDNVGSDCGLGFEKTPSREVYAKFTDPLYISEPVVAITSLKVNDAAGMTFTQMLAKYRILVKENYTLGDGLTAQVMRSPKKYVTSIDSDQMVQMISRGDADFMMISNDEVKYYVKHGILDPRSIHVIMLPDIHIRFSRRIMCSKSVDDKVIQRLNRAIATLKIKPSRYIKAE